MITEEVARLRRILVVDDSPVNRKLAAISLRVAGFDVIEADGGIQALEKVETESPDLILLDAVMPDLDGFEVLTRLRAQRRKVRIPVLMLTSLTEVEDKVRALELGADDFVSKPFNKVELEARVRSHLRIRALVEALDDRTGLLNLVLERYVSRQVAERILARPGVGMELGGFSCRVSVLMSDIRGFTAYSEGHDPAEVVQTLNAVFGVLAPCVVANGGDLDKLMGDCLMARFGPPEPGPLDALEAVRAGCSMLHEYAALRVRTPALGDLGLGIGIATGDAIVGNIGSEQLMDYTTIGRVPNLASRLQDAAGDGELLIDQATADGLPEAVRGSSRLLRLKGVRDVVTAWSVDVSSYLG